jgi:hypothetical protein
VVRRIAANIAKLPDSLLQSDRGIVGVDDAGKPSTTFLALKIVAFKTASVDFKITFASNERYLGRARRTQDDSPV